MCLGLSAGQLKNHVLTILPNHNVLLMSYWPLPIQYNQPRYFDLLRHAQAVPVITSMARIAV